MTLRARIFDSLPVGLTDCAATDLAALLGGPALIRVEGLREPPLFVSVLLHGNEVSGWEALRRLLREPEPLSRSMIVLIGNVHAAAAGVRVLPGQHDYNRIWRGPIGVPEDELARTVREWLVGRPLFAALDLHNNTGHNPHYSVLTRLDGACRGLAYLFSDTAVFVEEPDTVLARVFDRLCPVATLELGPVGDPMCEERALAILTRCLAVTTIPEAGAIKLYRTRARVHVNAAVDFSFVDDARRTSLVLTSGVEGVNFHELERGTRFGRSERPLREVLRVLDAAHRDVTSDYFEIRDGDIELRRPVVPAMYTTDPLVVMQDCLCYFMEPMET